MKDDPLVYVVDDEPCVRDSLRFLIESSDLAVETHATAEEFLAAYDQKRLTCLVLDLRMPRMSGVALQRELLGRASSLPIIMISGHDDLASAISAMKMGAVDFLVKPIDEQLLLDRVRSALERATKMRTLQARRAEVAARIAYLTPREREVMEMLVAGMGNKAIAWEFGLSCKTVEVHRARVMAKMQVDSLVHLVRLVTLQGEGDTMGVSLESDPSGPASVQRTAKLRALDPPAQERRSFPSFVKAPGRRERRKTRPEPVRRVALAR